MGLLKRKQKTETLNDGVIGEGSPEVIFLFGEGRTFNFGDDDEMMGAGAEFLVTDPETFAERVGSVFQAIEPQLNERIKKYPRVVYCKAAGVTFAQPDRLLECSQPGHQVRLAHDPKNPKDPKAVAITCDEHNGKHRLGFVPADLAHQLVDEFGEGCKGDGHITMIFLKHNRPAGLRVVGTIGQTYRFIVGD